MDYVYVGLGSALGGILRHWLGVVIGARLGASLPWATILINVTGSFAIGYLTGWLGSAETPHSGWGRLVMPLLVVGLLGGYTTFSAFSLQTLKLVQAGNLGGAAFNVSFSVLAGLGAAAAGFSIGKAVSA